MPIVAFDNVEFARQNQIGGEFYTPLGVGVWFRDGTDFRKAFHEAAADLTKAFNLHDDLHLRTASYLKFTIGLRRAVPYCDQLIQVIREHIRQIFVSYVILPPTKLPEVFAGGVGTPYENIKTAKFLR